MKSILIIALLAASAIAVSAELNFPSSDYYGSYAVSVVNVDVSKIVLPSELKEIMNKARSPAKNIYNEIFIPLADPTESEMKIIIRELLSAFFYPPLPIAPGGFRLYRIGTRDVGGFKRYYYSDEEYHLYALV